MDLTKIKRDKRTQALINTDLDALAAYKTQRDRQKKLETLEQDINNMKSDLGEIKTLLSEILSSRGK